MIRARGFTLLELLVAIGVFAVMALAAYQGLDSVLATRAHVADAGARLAELQLGMFRMERDLQQVVARPIRDDHGQSEPALVTAPGAPIPLAFTRDGWENPLGLPRSSLQRVAYRLQDGILYRSYWTRLDRGIHMAPRETPLITGVQDMDIRLLAGPGTWETRWPPPADAVDGNLSLLPRAIEITLELADWGTVSRLLPLPEAP